VTVPAPLAGVITERSANVGLNVDPSTALFKVVDLSTVWVVADLYERDFASVTVGTLVTVTTAAYPGIALPGKVNYIDPQVNPDTRTAKLRIEVANRGQQLRLGMYAAVAVTGAATSDVLVVPRTAVQTVDDRQVVYLADPKQPGKFVEREVRLGNIFGKDVQVTSGVMASDLVVAEGSFSLRAERERLGLRGSGATVREAQIAAAPPTALANSNLQQATVMVGDTAFDPATLTLRAGVPARVTLVRTSPKTCATEVVFPTLNIKKALPLNEPVTIDFTPQNAGEMAFACGMNKLKGRIVVQDR
jgi:plastocyanin